VVSDSRLQGAAEGATRSGRPAAHDVPRDGRDAVPRRRHCRRSAAIATRSRCFTVTSMPAILPLPEVLAIGAEFTPGKKVEF
jgi:hypothetical protein